jgi:hypothetical protein
MGSPNLPVEQTITHSDFVAVLSNPDLYHGTNFIGFDMKTPVVLKGGKSNPLQGQVFKIHEGFSGMIFSNKESSAYENMVNRRRALAGQPADFKAGALPWGTRIEGTAVIEHKGEHYLQLIYTQRPVSLQEFAEKEMGMVLTESQKLLFKSMGDRVAAFENKCGRTYYEVNGIRTDPNFIEGLDLKPESSEQGGLGDTMKVIIRSPKISSFTRLAVFGKTYWK